MRKSNKITLLKIAFWLGAITDALAAIIMMFPEFGTYLFKHENVVSTPEYRYALGMGAGLMVGWTVLLIWGSLKPLERKGILVITVFPVITGIVLAQIYAVSCGYIALNNMIPIWIHLTVLSSYFLFTFIKSNKLNNR